MSDIDTSDTIHDAETREVVTEETAELALASEGSAMLRAIGSTSSEQLGIFGFDADSPEGIRRIFNAQEDGESLSESGETELTLEGILLQPGVRVDPVSGARTACVTTILMTEGHNYVSQSNGIAHTAARIVGLYTRLGWPEEGVPVHIKEQTLDRGRSYKKLVLA